jgi:hypothetical protein
MRKRIILLSSVLAVATVAVATTAGQRFYNDDPIAREPESRSAAGAKPLDLALFYEYAYNLFVTGRRPTFNIRAGNINTIDEVPDSSWFTNRIGTLPITTELLVRGPNSDVRPAPEKWVLLREKSSGTNPGFTAQDANGRTWFLQFDIPEFPEGGTGAVEIATKLFWALGYNQVETFITTFDPSHAEIDPKARKRPSGARTPFTRDDMTRVLERAAQCRRHLPGCRSPASGKGARAVPVSGTRSDDRTTSFSRAAARSARSAFSAPDEPGGLEGWQHARCAG